MKLLMLCFSSNVGTFWSFSTTAGGEGRMGRMQCGSWEDRGGEEGGEGRRGRRIGEERKEERGEGRGRMRGRRRGRMGGEKGVGGWGTFTRAPHPRSRTAFAGSFPCSTRTLLISWSWRASPRPPHSQSASVLSRILDSDRVLLVKQVSWQAGGEDVLA
eukprot:758328-Hanusia_phi.AAC.11